MTALSRLSRSRSSEEQPRILCTTVNALIQRVPPREKIAVETFSAAIGNVVPMDTVTAWVEANGFLRTGTVRETGEYAVRGGILDLSPPGLPNPIRLDFFGDTLESIRAFDPETQRTVGSLRSLDLVPMSEVQLTTETIRRFRQGYISTFGAATRDDRLYETISEGRRYAGLEHWMPLFYDHLDTLFDYVPGVPLVFDAQAEEAVSERLTLIRDYYDAPRRGDEDAVHRRRALQAAQAVLPLPDAERLEGAGRRRLRRPALALRGAREPGPPNHRLRGQGGPQLRRRAGGRDGQRVRRRRRPCEGAPGIGSSCDPRILVRRLA